MEARSCQTRQIKGFTDWFNLSSVVHMQAGWLLTPESVRTQG